MGGDSAGSRGHEGHSLERRAADEIVRIEPEEWAGCLADLSGLDLPAPEDAEVATVAQALDVEPVKLRCTEYCTVKATCPACVAVISGRLPDRVFGSVCCGPNVKAANVLLLVRGHMSVERVGQMMHALLDAAVFDRIHQRPETTPGHRTRTAHA